MPTAAEGAGRLFDWADELSENTYRALRLPDVDQAALASDFGAVGRDLDTVLHHLLNYMRHNSRLYELLEHEQQQLLSNYFTGDDQFEICVTDRLE